MNQIGWINFSQKHRDRVMLVMDMYKNQGVIDELGLGTIRDSISNKLFPGTSTIQTRAKYFLLIPWILQEVESKGRLDRFRSDLDELEVSFVKVLRKNSPELDSGVIGRTLANANPRRKPSSIYWNGLRTYDILEFPGSLSDYITNLRSYNKKKQMNDADGNVPGNDRDASHLDQHRLWTQLPKPPTDWKENLIIDLTGDEAKFLKERIVLSNSDSLWAYALNFIPDTAKSFSNISDFLTVETLPKHLKELVKLAVDFNFIMQGALIQYNLLIQLSREKGRTTELLPVWTNYWNGIIKFDWNNWDIHQLWEACPRTPIQTKRFVENWIEIATSKTFDETRATQLLKTRELNLKGIRRARLHDKAIAQSQESFTGITVYKDESVSYLNYRWNTVKVLLNDIQNGLEKNVTT